MPKAVEEIQRRIVELTERSPGGVVISDLEEVLDASRRTLQRHLRDLVERGDLRREGEGRGTRYFGPELGVETPGPEPTGSQPSFTDEAERARQRIQRPLRERRRVTYRTPFLEDYEPGVTWYLPASIRRYLVNAGSLAERRLPAGTYARQILDRLLIDLSWNSSRLEGNTYSLLETERLLEAGVEARERDPFETQMILNHKAAIEYLVDSAEELSIDRGLILNLHALLSDNLLANPADGGRLRHQAVGITGSVFEPLQNPHQIGECFDRLLLTANAITDPFEQAFFLLAQLPYLQPFIDVNKRVSRLAANIPFIAENLSPLSFVEVAPVHYAQAMLAIYEDNDIAILRDLFVWAYERSAQRYRVIRDSLGEPDPLRLQRRTEIRELIARIIRDAMSPSEATQAVARFALSLPAEEQARFSEIIEQELAGLHEGNFARYRVRPSEFRAWQEQWS